MADQATFIKMKEAESALGLSSYMVLEMSKSGQLPQVTKIGNRYYFEREAFLKSLENIKSTKSHIRKLG